MNHEGVSRIAPATPGLLRRTIAYSHRPLMRSTGSRRKARDVELKQARRRRDSEEDSARRRDGI